MLSPGHSSASVHLLSARRPSQGSTTDEPMSIAIEHVRWCRARGDNYAQIIRSVGFTPSSQPDFDEAACVLAAAARSSTDVR
jgi:hypothetical protein